MADKDSENTRFSRCAFPFLSVLPGIVIALIATSHVLHLPQVSKRWRPNWAKPLVQELPQEQDEAPSNNGQHPLIWAIALFSLSIPALVAQVVKLKFLELRLHGVLLLLSCTVASLFILLSRPRSCPTSLLAFYVSVLVVEGSSIHAWIFPPGVEGITHQVAASAAVASIAVILAMPMRLASLHSDYISRVGTTPNSTERSPEDNLRLWQFLCISWVNPLITLGKKRQLQEDDVWLLGFEFQHRRLHEAFRQLRGSVLNRLIQANGIDCCILVLTSFVQLFCGKSS